VKKIELIGEKHIGQGEFAQGRCSAPAERSSESGRDDTGAFSGVGWHEEIEHLPIRKWAL